MQNKSKHLNLSYFLFVVFLFLFQQNGYSAGESSDLEESSFSHYWQPESSDSSSYRLTFFHDTLEIATKEGFTLWRKDKMSGNIEISYSACVMVGQTDDRLSDLNCFWMASDPLSPEDIFRKSKWRGGVFEKYYSLKMYYLGYGGNHNTTTRFRKYDGDWKTFSQTKVRPAIITEYTDSAHLLKPNHWYHIRIVCRNNHIQYFMDDELLVDYQDNQPLKSGWFGFRTTKARVRITGFQQKNLDNK